MDTDVVFVCCALRHLCWLCVRSTGCPMCVGVANPASAEAGGRGCPVAITLRPQRCAVWYHRVPGFRPAQCTLLLSSSRSLRAASRPQQPECPSQKITGSLWLVPTLRALRLSNRLCLNPTLAGYSLSVVCVATLSDAPLWCKCGPAELQYPVDVVTDGSRDGDRVGWSAVVVSPKGVVAEAWSWCAMVGAS